MKPMTQTTLFTILSGIPSLLYALFHDLDASAPGIPLKVTQRKVLVIIETLQGATMTHISRMAGLKKGSFTSVADSLIEAGYVERGEDPKDRRKVILRLTPEGKAVARRIIHRIELHLEKKLSRLEPSQRRELMDAFTVLSSYADRLK